MKKLAWVMAFLSFFACWGLVNLVPQMGYRLRALSLSTGTGSPTAIVVTRTALASPSPLPTVTPTVGHQATAAAAQNTADSAMRVMAAATVEHEQRLSEQMQATAAAEARAHQSALWTATAMSTSVPLTATAQRQNYEMVIARSTAVSVAATRTAYYPTAIVAAERARLVVEYAEAERLVNMVAIGVLALAVFFLLAGLGRYLAHKPRVVEKVVEMPGSHQVEITRRANGCFQRQYSDLPEALTGADMANIAQHLQNGGRFSRRALTPAKDNLISRDTFDALCQWLRDNHIRNDSELEDVFYSYI